MRRFASALTGLAFWAAASLVVWRNISALTTMILVFSGLLVGAGGLLIDKELFLSTCKDLLGVGKEAKHLVFDADGQVVETPKAPEGPTP